MDDNAAVKDLLFRMADDALPIAGFCTCTDPPSRMLFACIGGGMRTFTVSPACASTGS